MQWFSINKLSCCVCIISNHIGFKNYYKQNLCYILVPPCSSSHWNSTLHFDKTKFHSGFSVSLIVCIHKALIYIGDKYVILFLSDESFRWCYYMNCNVAYHTCLSTEVVCIAFEHTCLSAYMFTTCSILIKMMKFNVDNLCLWIWR